MVLVLRKYLAPLVLIIFVLFLVSLVNHLSFAQTVTPTSTPTQDNSQEVRDLQNQINDLQNKIADLQGQEKTLSSQIAVMNSQIKLTQLRIDSTKQQITDITLDIDTTNKKISTLQNSLVKLTRVLINRIIATYEVGTVQPFHVLLSSSNVSNFFSRLNYLKIAQEHDKRLIYDTTQAKNDYSNQKSIFEDKKRQVEALKAKLEGYTQQLEREKAGKQELLRVTKNDEANYQRLLAQAQAERAIVLGGGKEILLRNVNLGDSIATIIPTISGCSTGPHLHFSFYQGTSVRDPNDYLSSKSFSYSYDSSLYDYYGTINPHGSYPWPLDDPITINQGYGPHSYASRYPGGIHDGIDMEGGSPSVKAVRSGKLYQGSYGGCSYGPLNYVKVEHDDGLITWYLHTIAN